MTFLHVFSCTVCGWCRTYGATYERDGAPRAALLVCENSRCPRYGTHVEHRFVEYRA